MRTIIIEDEEGPLIALRNQLSRHCPELQVVGCAGTLAEAHELLRSEKPELVFLDISLPDGSAFDLLDQWPSPDFKVIFITAHDEYAIKAFQYNAVHYLLKPLISEELLEAVSRVRAEQAPEYATLRSLINKLQSKMRIESIVIPSVAKIHFVKIEDIIRLESDGPYSVVYLTSGEKILSSRPLKTYDELLAPVSFYRVHRSHLVNLTKVKEYLKAPHEAAVLMDDSRVEVSRNNKLGFLRAMKGLGVDLEV